MRHETHLLIAAFLVLAAAPLRAAEPVDYNRRLTSSGAVPQYPIPYILPSTNEVMAVVERIGHYVIENT